MADFDIVAYLSTKGYTGRQANGSEVVYPCFFDCNEPAHSSKRKLYCNTEDGWYNCKVCGAAGGTYLLQTYFGDDPREKGGAAGPDPTVRRRILRDATTVAQEMLLNNDKFLLWLLDERGLSYDTIQEYKLGAVTNGWSLVGSIPGEFSKENLLTTGLVYREGEKTGRDFYYDHILIPYLSRGSTVQIRGRQNPFGSGRGGKYLTGPGDDCFLYNQDALDGYGDNPAATDVIITEGEFDTLVLQQHLRIAPEERLRRIAVVGLAGVDAHPPNFMELFAKVKRIYVAFDSDEAGQRAAQKLKELFGAKARIINLPVGSTGKKCDWSEYLLQDKHDADDMWRAEHPFRGHTWRDISQLIAEASGKRIRSMSEIGVNYRAFKASNQTGLKTGFRELDLAILPGILPGQVCIVLAKTGTGKTIFLCNLAYNMRNHHVLFISLEMTQEEVYERLRRIYLFYHPNASDEVIEAAYSKVFVCDENRLSEQDFAMLVDEYEVETGVRPEVAFIDYLGYYARGARGNSPYEKVSNAVMQLKAEAKKHKLGVIVPAQVNRDAKEGKPIDLDDARDAGTVEETADFLLSLYRPDDSLQSNIVNAQPTWKMMITVLKSRHGGKGKKSAVQGDPYTLVMVNEGTTEARRAESHAIMYGHQKYATWEEMRADELREIAKGTQHALPGTGRG